MATFFYRPIASLASKVEELKDLHSATKTITFKAKDNFAIILPDGVQIEGKTYTTHKQASAASRWAIHHKGLCINSIIVDRQANTYNAYRDTTNGKYKLEPTGEILLGFGSANL